MTVACELVQKLLFVQQKLNYCLIIHGQAVVVAIGKPVGAHTFGDLADVFVEHVLVSGKCVKRIDVTFDRYIDNSTKSGTRKNRLRKARPIRMIVDDRTVASELE